MRGDWRNAGCRRSWRSGLLTWVMWKYDGIRVVTEVVRTLGWNFLWLLIPWALSALITILAYRTTLPDRGKAIPFFTLVQVERSGSALNAILPLGNHGGQIVKIALLRHWFPSEAIVAAALWVHPSHRHVQHLGRLRGRRSARARLWGDLGGGRAGGHEPGHGPAHDAGAGVRAQGPRGETQSSRDGHPPRFSAQAP